MKVNFEDCIFRNNKIGVSVPDNSDTEYSFIGTKFERNGQGFLVRDSESLKKQLGLPKDTDPELLNALLKYPKELVKLFTTLNETAINERLPIINQSGFVKNLGITADSVTLVTLIYSISISPNFQNFIAFLINYLSSR
jgi:hypothetical protein